MDRDRTIESVESGASDARLVATLAQAFQGDPALSWLLPNAAARARRLPLFFKVMAEQSRRRGTILASHDRGAVSLWYPPGKVVQPRFADLLDNLRLVGVFRSALPRGLKLAEAMYSHHPSPQEHDYLRYVGVAPEAQGKGWGGAIVRAGIARAAQKGRGVLLETATPDNVAIYSRLGFEIISEWTAPDDGPKFWTMVHPAP